MRGQWSGHRFAVALAFLATAGPVWGHGQLDQSYNPADGTSGNCGEIGTSEFQSFTPSVSPLVAVDVYVDLAPDTTMTVRIRAGSPTGTVLSTVTTHFPSTDQPLHFDLPVPLAVTPGVTLVLEVVYPTLAASWLLTAPGGGYPFGQAYGCTGNPIPDGDHHFATYTADCVASATTLCLHGGRFRVTADWRIPDGRSGVGQAVQLTNDAGYFWFFDAANVEVLVKMVDACTFNDRFWTFSSGLTDVRVDLTVLDTKFEAGKTYVNPLHHAFTPILDTNAFATCP